MNKKEVLSLNQEDFLAKLQTSGVGLTQKEATGRLAVYGPNVLGKKTGSALKVLGRQFQSSLIYLLIIASIISYGIKDFTDGTVILVILLINTLLGFYQEYKSEKIIEKLSQFIGRQVRVKRSGKDELLDESQIVPGDVVTVHEGDIMPADIRLLKADDLQVNESQLTGESVPVIKGVSSDSQAVEEGLLFTGSTIEKGAGTGVVYASGKNTELGTIATLSTQTKKDTQYEKSLRSFSAFLMKVVIYGLLLIFVAKLLLNHRLSNFSELLLFVIAMAVAAVPEALPVIATVSLSSGALKLAKRHVVVKRLSSMEDLGNINLLCTDKTGTITENKMIITKVNSSDTELLLKFAFAAIAPLKGRKRRAQNSYDDAFINYVSAKIKDEARQLTIAKELPFDPEDRRRRVVLADSKNHKHYLLVMGAPEVLLEIAQSENKGQTLKVIATEGKMGLHQLALAYKEVSFSDEFDILKNETNLAFLGYVSMTDPLRPSVKATIEHAEKLGIQIKILSGDSREVAEYIGGQIGLVKPNSKVYVGSELESMNPEEFKAAVLNSSVFARVSPTDKYNIIKVLKETFVVGYQGDGINDAPALKLADVAIAVNSATDIAKENADIVLLNKSLEVIINGIKYGRSIFVNINKYIKYTMVSNFGNFIALAVLYLYSANLPILPIQVLLTTVITDIPLISIYDDSVEDGEVVRPEKHDVKELVLISLVLGIPTALFELLYFFIIRSLPQAYIQTSLYAFFTLIGLIIFYAIRNKQNFWKAKPPPALVNISFTIGFIFSFAIIYARVFQDWFSFVPLSAATTATILIMMAVYFFAADWVKVWYFEAIAKTNQVSGEAENEHNR